MPEQKPDYRMYADFPTHPKTLELVAELGIMGRVSLENLWAYAASHRPLGYLDGMNENTIEYAAGWRGEGRKDGAFFEYLLAHKWLEEAKHHITDEMCLYLHDWRKYQPHLSTAYEAGLRGRLVRLGHDDTRPVYLFFHYWGVPGIEEQTYQDSIALWRAKSPRQTDAEVLIDLLPKKLQPECHEWIKKYHYLWSLDGVREVKICDDYTFRVVHDIDAELEVKNIIYKPGDHRIITESEAESKGNYKKKYRSCGMDGELILAPDMVAKSVDAKDFDLASNEPDSTAAAENNETICIHSPTEPATTREQDSRNEETGSAPVPSSCAITPPEQGGHNADDKSSSLVLEEGKVCNNPSARTDSEPVEIVPVPEIGTREEALIFLRNNLAVLCGKSVVEVCDLFAGKDKNRWGEIAKNRLIQFNSDYDHFKGIELKKQIEESPRHPGFNCPSVLDYVNQHEFFFAAVCHKYDFDTFPDRNPHPIATMNDLALILRCDHNGELQEIKAWKRRVWNIPTKMIFDFVSRNISSLKDDLVAWREEILRQYEFVIEDIPENADQLDIATLSSFIRKAPDDGTSLRDITHSDGIIPLDPTTTPAGISEIIIFPPRLKGVTGGAIRFVPADERFRLPQIEVIDPNQPKPEAALAMAGKYTATEPAPATIPADDVRNTLNQFGHVVSSETPVNANLGPNLKETVVPLSFHKAALMRKSQDAFYEEYAAKLKASGELPDYTDADSPLKWYKQSTHTGKTASSVADTGTTSMEAPVSAPNVPVQGMTQAGATYNQQPQQPMYPTQPMQPNVPLQGQQAGGMSPQSQNYQQSPQQPMLQRPRPVVPGYNQNYYTAFGVTVTGAKDITCATMVDMFQRFRSLIGYHHPDLLVEWQNFIDLADEYSHKGLDVEFSFNKAWEAFHHSPDFKDLRDPNSPNSLASPMAWIRKWFERGIKCNFEKSLMRRDMWTKDNIKPLMERQAREAAKAAESGAPNGLPTGYDPNGNAGTTANGFTPNSGNAPSNSAANGAGTAGTGPENGLGPNEGYQTEGRDTNQPNENVG